MDHSNLRSARIAVSVAFYVFGMAWALWAIHIPAVTARLALDPAILGLALLNVGLGGVISQPLTGWLVSRVGSRPATVILLPLCILVPLLPIVAWNIPMLFAGAFALGIIGGGANVAVNTQAAEVEVVYGTPILSSFHGFFSLGALSGALAGSAMLAMSLQDGRGAAIVAVPLLIVSIILGPFYLNAPPKPRAARVERTGRMTIPAWAVLFLAGICFFTNTVEGAVADWSSLYLSTVRQLPTAIAGGGYAAFTLVMAISRFAGGPLVARLGERQVVLYGGILIAVGTAVVVLSPWAALSPFGFGILAAGAANNFPVLISAGSRVPGASAGAGVAAVATGGLLGMLIGPPIIGFAAHALGLAAGIGLLMGFGLIVVVAAATYRWPQTLGKTAATSTA